MNMIEMHKASFVLCSPGEPTLQTKPQPVPTSKISMSCFHGHQWIQNSLLKKIIIIQYIYEKLKLYSRHAC